MRVVPEVSIIIPCYNYGHFLRDALSSVQMQTFHNWECIIIDNGSSDNTKQVAESFLSFDSRFKYIYSAERGVSRTRNIGIQNALGKFILPLDADDLIGGAYIEKAIKILNNNGKIKIAYCQAELFGERKGRWNLPEFSWKEFLLENMIFASCLYRRKDWESVGGFDIEFEDGLEDWDFLIGILKSGGEVYCIPEVLFYYRIHSASRNSVVVKELSLQREIREKIYKKHKELYEKHFNLSDLLWDYLQLRNKMTVVSNELSRLKNTKAYRFYKKIF
jgi:glycosyltransferase involved in cell wall biosynthesis